MLRFDTRSGTQLFTILGHPSGSTGLNTLFYVGAAGNGWIAGTLTQAFDVRLKKDIVTTHYGLDALLSLRGVEYFWKDSARSPDRQLGLIAQEVEKVIPELVTTDANGEKAVAYSNFVPVLIEALKTEHAERELLAKKLEDERADKERLAKKLEDVATYLCLTSLRRSFCDH